MRRKGLLFTALSMGLGSLLYGQTPTFVFSPTTLSDGLYGSVYTSQSLTVTGGTAPYAFTVSSGSLPPGMQLSNDGTLSGTPTAAGSYSFTVTATDNSSSPGPYSGVQAYTLVVDQAPLTITANNAIMLYGGVVPVLGVTYSGFVNGDNPSNLTSQPAVNTTASSSSPVATYGIAPSGAADPNYIISYVNGSLTINPAPLTVKANDAGMTYGGAVPVLDVSYTGFVNGENASSLTSQPTVSTTAGSSSPAGTYPITASGASDPNYNISYQPGTMTVARAVLTVTGVNQAMTYGATVPALTVSFSGFVNGDNASSLTTQPTVNTTATSSSPAGSYAITSSGAADPNYSINYVDGVLTINPAALTISAANANMIYGSAVPSLNVLYTGFVNGDNASNLTSQPTVSTTASASSPVGTYPITPSGAADPNYTITYQAGTMTVGKAGLTVTANNQTMPLGGPLPALTVSYAGFVNGDNVSSLTTPSTATTSATASSPAGTYTITASGGSSPNYNFAYVNGSLSVEKGILTVIANNASMTYGGAVPALTVSYTGFVNGDDASSLTTQPTVNTTAGASSPAGTYPIAVSGASDPNYVISYQAGTMTVNKAPLTVTAANQAMTYGSAVPVLTVTYAGFVNGDNGSSLTTQPTVTTTATPSSPAGTYPITASAADDPNYTISYQPGTITVGKAALTVTANNQTMPLGGPLPPLTVSYSGFVNGDNVSSLTTPSTATTTATAGSGAGTYPITASGGSSPNYSFTYVSGILSVGKAVLTITATNATMTYGSAVPVLSVTYSGFVNGDNASSLTTQPTITTTASPSSPAGTYPITASGASDPNYVISYQTGTMTVNKAPLTVTAANQAMTYGATVPALTVSYSGFVNGDNASKLSIQPTVGTTAGPSSPAGSYPITVSGAAAANYAISFVNGTLTINPAALTVKANNASMTYGGAVPALSATYSGFVNGENVSSLTTQAIVSTTAAASSPAGTYPIVASGATDPNYSITYQAGTMTVGKASLTVTADNKAMPLGGPLPALTVSYAGFVNGDNASSLTTAPTATTTALASSPAGAYPIKASGGVSNNYNFSYVNGTLTVATAVLTITANPASSVYGAALVPGGSLTVTYSGFVNGDGPGNLTALPTVTNTAVAGAPAGSYSLIPSGAASPNYAIQYVNGTYTVRPAPLTISAANQTMTYGGTLPVPTVTYSGFVNGDNVSRLTTAPTVTTTAVSSSPAGVYPITVSGAADPNYSITFNPGTLTINPATLHVTSNAQTKPYGAPDPAFTYA
ncbi:MAG TPA: MBG domain-containing protein, partial [Puia sp.]|nr:MBG domain-containing protein [Puia sp.]